MTVPDTETGSDATLEVPEEDGRSRWRRFLRRGSIVATIALIFTLMGVASAIHAIMNTRTSQGAIAWAVSLVSVPYVAVPAYWVLGRSKFEGYVGARQLDEERLRELVPEAFQEPPRPEILVTPETLEKEGVLAGYHVLNRLTDFPLTRGNEVELLVDGDATFESILAGIDRAQDYILVQFFIVKDDEVGTALQRRLIAKAKEGVRVYFVYDEIGSNKLPRSYGEELRAAGVEFSPFNTTQGSRNRFQLNFRNHRKIVVVDGREGWVGGHNVGDEYLGRDPKFGHWRDTHIRILGPAVLMLQFSFVEDWHWATKQAPRKLNWRAAQSETRDQRVIVVPSSPADERETATLLFLQAITGAKERIWIASPYFVPDPDILGALQLADLRGVDVRILIPDEPDHMLVYLAAFTFVEELRETEIEFYRYQDGFLHQKVLLIDDRVAAVGTANLDNRSMRLNFEVMAVVADQPFASEIEQMLEADFAKSRRMAPDELSRKSWWFRFKARAARLAGPIL